jgi:hypothetical protein
VGGHEKNACDKPAPEVGGFLGFEITDEREREEMAERKARRP